MVQGGPNSGTTISVTGRPLTLGRRQDNDIVVDESTVSRRHALIMETPQGMVVRDLSTTNGTFVNNKKVGQGEQLLNHGDLIKLAGSDVTFVFHMEPSATQKMETEGPVTGQIDLGDSLDRQDRDLTGKAADLHRLLKSRDSAVVSREEIARSVWPEMMAGSELDGEMYRAVEAIRKEIGDDVDNPQRLIPAGEFGFLLL